MAEFAVPLRDFSNQASIARFPVDDAVADIDLTGFLADIQAMIVGAVGQTVLEIATPKDAGPGGNAADKHAQIELKWLCKYHDGTVPADEYTLEIPCPDATLLSAGTENLDLAGVAGLEFKTQFDATVKAPNTGNAVVLDEVILVGRNL